MQILHITLATVNQNTVIKRGPVVLREIYQEGQGAGWQKQDLAQNTAALPAQVNKYLDYWKEKRQKPAI